MQRNSEYVELFYGEAFYGTRGVKKNDLATDIVVLTPNERQLIDTMLDALKTPSPEICAGIRARLADMEHLARCIARFPSLLEQNVIMGEMRNRVALIDLLTAQHEGDKVLFLPSKATLGKSFLVAKFHTFLRLLRVAHRTGLPEPVVAQLESATNTVLFTLMAEDVYLSLLDDKALSAEVRRQIAMALIILWEYRSDSLIQDIAPVLREAWDARKNLAPIFGTMMGSSELVLIAMELGATWNAFVAARVAHEDVRTALEEFLFGLSFEHIRQLRRILEEKGVHAIDRSEISAYLGIDVKTDLHTDSRDFYMQYSVRRDNARVRRRLNYPGPRSTLEDYYMSFVLAQHNGTQFDAVFARSIPPPADAKGAQEG